MADRLWVMHEGTIVQGGTPAETYLHPADAFVASLFGPLNRLSGRVRAGRIETPVGAADAPGFADGARVQVLVRPEGVQAVEVANSGGGGKEGAAGDGRIVTARLLGRCSHLRIAVEGLEEPLQALAPGVFLPDPGTPVIVQLDGRHVFVFAEG